MSDDTMVVRTYMNDLEAHLDAAVLEAHGVPSRVSADTAGGLKPFMAPIRLLARAEDVALAVEILDAPAEPSDGDDEDEAPSA
jgi:hypothetical protein